METKENKKPGAVEWPTVILAAAVYAAFGGLTLGHDMLTGWPLVLLGGIVVCLHGSLQHEVVHGHPTGIRRLNELLVFPSLWLWMPFRLYRRTHLLHHHDARLTDPLEDPESYYVTPAEWAAMGPLRRGFLTVHNSLAGRLILGPLVCVPRLFAAEFPKLLAGDRQALRTWAPQVLSVALVLGWVVGVCGLPLLDYLLCFVYPGLSLTLLRSFLEHRAQAEVSRRTAIVEAGPLFSLLFLNNNLHALHHAEPALAWYRLPARYRETRDRLLTANGNYCLHGYREIVARYLLWPKEHPRHPLMAAASMHGEALRPHNPIDFSSESRPPLRGL